jgi:hypothetical protein
VKPLAIVNGQRPGSPSPGPNCRRWVKQAASKFGVASSMSTKCHCLVRCRRPTFWGECQLVEKAQRALPGAGGPCWGAGEYARVRSRLTGSPGTAFHRQPKFALVDCSTRGHVEERCYPRTPSVGQRKCRSLPESHPSVSDRQTFALPVKDGDLRTVTQATAAAQSHPKRGPARARRKPCARGFAENDRGGGYRASGGRRRDRRWPLRSNLRSEGP